MAKWIDDFRQGDTVEISFVYGKNITGYTFWCTLKSSFKDEDADAALQVSSVAGSHVADNLTTGAKTIVLPAASTKLITPGSYYYDVQAVSGTGVVDTFLPPVEDYDDKVLVAPEITRSV